MDRSAVKAATEPNDLERARGLVLAHGWNSTSYQIINPGIRRWFSAAGDAVAGYKACAGVRVAVGAPACTPERLVEAAAEFERDAQAARERVCYFCAEQRMEDLYENSPNYSRVLLGAQPAWRPAGWADIIAANKSLRAQVNRSRNKGVSVSEWPVEKATDNRELENCLNDWLAAKGLPPLHFMVEPNTLSRLFDRRVFVAERSSTVEGFLIVSPIPRRNGWLFEQFVHRPGAPNGTVELMIDAAMRVIAAEGYEYATLGLAPLSTRAKTELFDNPLWLRFLLGWMRLHGQRFYNFEGLDAFKAKLRPDMWEPVFAIYNRPAISFRMLYAIGSAFSNNRPFSLVLGGLARAVRTELKWLKNRVRGNKN
jgi:phosphatidylglycerol lysyltransferase